MPSESPYHIETSAYQIALPLPVTELEDAARAVLASENVAAAELSLAVVDGEQMQAINKRHLDHDYDTDVLSFLLEASELSDGRSIEGEIIVSVDMARKQSIEYQTDIRYELVLYIVHGTLHLCGYDDLTAEDAAVMRQRERELMDRPGMGDKRQG